MIKSIVYFRPVVKVLPNHIIVIHITLHVSHIIVINTILLSKIFLNKLAQTINRVRAKFSTFQEPTKHLVRRSLIDDVLPLFICWINILHVTCNLTLSTTRDTSHVFQTSISKCIELSC